MPARPAGPGQMPVGGLDVLFVPDGEIRSTPRSSYPGSPAALWHARPDLLDADGLLVMSLGSLLVRSADRYVLVDLGWGPTELAFVDRATGLAAGGIRGGAMLDNLAAAGVRREDVDTILFSHLHRDHIGWIARDGEWLFPNARHLVAEAEWAYWTTSELLGVGPAPTKEQMEALTGRLEPLAEGDQPAPGIDVVATPGHTPGHLSFVLSSGVDRAVILGDAVHCPVEITEPELAFVANVDPALAARTRDHLEQELLQPGTLGVGTHFADVVFGRLLPGQGRPSWHLEPSWAR